MAKHKPAQTQEQETVPAEVSKLDMLEAFAELIAERWGYFLGRRLTQADMSEKCKAEIKAVNDKRKSMNKHVVEYLDNATPELRTTIKAEQKEIEELAKTASEVKKPFQEKIAPLAKAQKYCDNVAIPDSLKELGHAVQPRFSLSEWVSKAVEQSKKRK